VTAARSVAESMSPKMLRLGGSLNRAWRVAGFTPETFKEEMRYFDNARHAINGAISYLSNPIKAANIARAADLWRAGNPLPDGVSAYSLRDSQGGPLLRAEDVTRDAAGNITGGTLRTSQGAQVPLPHALKVFRFLRLMREKGEEWSANGRTVRVG